MRKTREHAKEMTIVDPLREMSRTLDGVSQLKDLHHEMTETGGEMLVLRVVGMTVIGVVVVQMTTMLPGVEVRHLVTTDHLVDQAGVVEAEAVVETTGDVRTVLVVMTLTDVTAIWTRLLETTTAETVTWTVVLQETGSMTELQETATLTAVIAMQTEDPVIETMTDHRRVTVIMTEAQEISIDETGI